MSKYVQTISNPGIYVDTTISGPVIWNSPARRLCSLGIAEESGGEDLARSDGIAPVLLQGDDGSGQCSKLSKTSSSSSSHLQQLMLLPGYQVIGAKEKELRVALVIINQRFAGLSVKCDLYSRFLAHQRPFLSCLEPCPEFTSILGTVSIDVGLYLLETWAGVSALVVAMGRPQLHTPVVPYIHPSKKNTHTHINFTQMFKKHPKSQNIKFQNIKSKIHFIQKYNKQCSNYKFLNSFLMLVFTRYFNLTICLL